MVAQPLLLGSPHTLAIGYHLSFSATPVGVSWKHRFIVLATISAELVHAYKHA